MAEPYAFAEGVVEEEVEGGDREVIPGIGDEVGRFGDGGQAGGMVAVADDGECDHSERGTDDAVVAFS